MTLQLGDKSKIYCSKSFSQIESLAQRVAQTLTDIHSIVYKGTGDTLLLPAQKHQFKSLFNNYIRYFIDLKGDLLTSSQALF